jgi:hypothetical protein
MTVRKALLAAMISSLFVCGAANAAFVCPQASVGANAAQDQIIAAAIPAGDALADVAKLNAAVADLRAKGVSNAVLVDSLIASYCPSAAQNAALSDEQKRAQVRRFAGRIMRLVYSLESADAVILDVPFAPDVMATINARAAAEKISPEAWVANTIARSEGGPIGALAAGRGPAVGMGSSFG